MAAEAYYRLTNRLAVVNVTSGPGGTNAITGVYGAFVDSCGMLVISGQVKIETTVRHTGLPLRLSPVGRRSPGPRMIAAPPAGISHAAAASSAAR